MTPTVVTIIDITNTKFYHLTWLAKCQIIYRLAVFYKSKGREKHCTVEQAAHIFDTKNKQTSILTKVVFKDIILASQDNLIALSTPDTISKVFLSRYLPPRKTYMIKTQQDLIKFLMSQDITDIAEALTKYEQNIPHSLAEEITNQVIEYVTTLPQLPQEKAVEPQADTAGKPQGIWYENWYENLSNNNLPAAAPQGAAVGAKAGIPPMGPGAKAHLTRLQIAKYKAMTTLGQKEYIYLNTTPSGGLRVPRTFVNDCMNKYRGDSVLVVGTKGIKTHSTTVKKDGSIYITAQKLSGLNRTQFQVRTEAGAHGHTLIIK